MPNILIRDVPSDDLELIRAAATENRQSLQAYLCDALRMQAAHLRRRAALAQVADRLRGGAAVPDSERDAVLDAIDQAHDERASGLAAHHD